MKLPAKYPYKDVYENACPKKKVSNILVSDNVFDEICLPHTIFCSARIVRKIPGNVVLKMLKYRKYSQQSSPTGGK
jgi:hypothetical protein